MTSWIGTQCIKSCWQHLLAAASVRSWKQHMTFFKWPPARQSLIPHCCAAPDRTLSMCASSALNVIESRFGCVKKTEGGDINNQITAQWRDDAFTSRSSSQSSLAATMGQFRAHAARTKGRKRNPVALFLRALLGASEKASPPPLIEWAE